MPEPRREREAADEIDAQDLIERGDAAGLLAMGAARRAEGDEALALECFAAAADLGSADARYLVALAHLTGRGTAVDLAEGARHLREAANGGHLRAKVYLANLYELGVHFTRDVEKADTWYRSVARSAGIEHEPGTPEHARAMATLGAARYCLQRVADPSLSAKERSADLQRAKAMGYALHQRALARAGSAPDAAVAKLEREAPARASETPEKTPAPREPEPAARKTPRAALTEEEDEPLPEPGSRWTIPQGTLALLVATCFLSAGAAAGWLAAEGARSLATSLPPQLASGDPVGLAVLVVLGALPATATYRLGVVASALGLALAGGAGAYAAFDSLALAPSAALQAGAAFAALYLATLAFVGMVGGTRLRPAQSAKRRRAPR